MNIKGVSNFISKSAYLNLAKHQVWCQWCQILSWNMMQFLRSESGETFSNNLFFCERKTCRFDLTWGWINDRISNFPTQTYFQLLCRWREPVTSLSAPLSSSLVLLGSRRLSFTPGPLQQLSTHSRLTDLYCTLHVGTPDYISKTQTGVSAQTDTGAMETTHTHGQNTWLSRPSVHILSIQNSLWN